MQEFSRQSNVYGVGTNSEIRDQQTFEFETRLTQGRVVYSEHVSTFPRSAGGRTIEELKRMLGVQLLGWEKIIEFKADKPLMRPKTGWSAKRSAGADDLAVALLMSWCVPAGLIRLADIPGGSKFSSPTNVVIAMAISSATRLCLGWRRYAQITA